MLTTNHDSGFLDQHAEDGSMDSRGRRFARERTYLPDTDIGIIAGWRQKMKPDAAWTVFPAPFPP